MGYFAPVLNNDSLLSSRFHLCGCIYRTWQEVHYLNNMASFRRHNLYQSPTH